MSTDYIIIGAGPTGLVIAYLLGKQGKSVLLVDQNETIGGCHRVTRQDGLFTEHAPRVYLSSYLNTKTLLAQMGSSFDELFTPYRFSISFIARAIISKLSFLENVALFRSFLALTAGFPTNQSVREFGITNGFSPSSRDYLDRLCRFSDGAGSERYSMVQLLNLINQQWFYGIYQPRLPNDKGLLPVFQQAIQNTQHVTFRFNTTVSSLLYDDATGLVKGIQTTSGNVIGKTVILAVPPPALNAILSASSPQVQTAFGANLSTWTQQTSYNVDIAATFHWNTTLDLPIIWGFPASEWGLISIPLTQYMDMQDNRSKTVISCCITYPDRVSTSIGLTANQVTESSTLVSEMFRQLKESYPTLPEPSFSILSPTVYRDDNQWKEQDSGYFQSIHTKRLPSCGTIPNLFQVGAQNGNSTTYFTTFEAAVTNGIAFVTNHAKTCFPTARPIELITVIRWGLLILIVLIIIVIVVGNMLKRNRS